MNPTWDFWVCDYEPPGNYVGQTEVAPLPAGSTPGQASTQPADAYEAIAIITKLSNGDNVTLQAYAVCGP